MINTDTLHTSHTTVADQQTWYSIDFPYDTDPSTGAPELNVTLDENVLTWSTDYIVGVQGLQLTAAPTADLELVIRRNIPLTQEQDFQTGLISAEQIEHGFDRSVMRDQELADYLNLLADIIPEVYDSKITIKQGGVIKGYFTLNQDIDAIINLDSGGGGGSVSWSDITDKPNFATVATSGNYSDLNDTPSLASVATSGNYNDLTNTPTIPDTTNMQVTTNLVTSVSAASTDLQYPSAKLFYDTCGDIETLINAL